MTIAIKVEQTPNPNAVKLTLNQTIFEGTKSYSYKKNDQPEHPLVAALLNIDGVDNIFAYQDIITVNKTSDADWDKLLPVIEKVFQNSD